MKLPKFTLIHERKPLQRITTNYTPRSAAAVSLAVDLSGVNQSDALNRAAQVYAYVLWLRAEGGEHAETATWLLGQL